MQERQPEPPEDRSARSKTRSIARGVLAGGGLLLAIMIAFAAAIALTGGVPRDVSGGIDLGPWLLLEIVAGAVAGALAGALCRRIAGTNRAATILAVLVVCFGLLEASVIASAARAGTVAASPWAILLAPFVGGLGILLGGWRRGGENRPRLPQGFRASEIVRCALPVVVLAGATVLATLVLPTLGENDARVVATALAFDFTVVVPGVVFFAWFRARRARWMAILPAFAVGYALATLTLPREHQEALAWLRWWIVPAELLLIASLLWAVHRSASRADASGDFASRFRSAAHELLGNRIAAGALATEISILAYAFRRRTRSKTETGFTSHVKANYGAVVFGLTTALVVETVAVHLVVSIWSSTAAWILTGLSVYGVVWLIGDYRALVARRTRVAPKTVQLRLGLRWEIDVPRGAIVSAERISGGRPEAADGRLVVSLLGTPNVRIVLDAPREVIGMYGIRRRPKEICWQVDDPDAFVEAVGPTSPPP